MLDLFQRMSSDEPHLDISLNNEGPCADNLGVYPLLDEICSRTQFNKNNITIETCNLLEDHDCYRIKKTPPIKHIAELQSLIRQRKIHYKDPKQIKNHFGHFIGHSSRFRLAIGSHLYHYHKNKTKQTFHSSPSDELHREFLGLEDMWFHGYSEIEIKNAVDFLNITPLRFDHDSNGPILHMKMYGILDAYPDVFLDIVCNTYINGKTFYLDEKLWRPIITKTPFMVHGSRDFIKNFKKLGFKTFNTWWDEGYSEDPPDCQVRAMIDNIDAISKYSVDELAQIYHDMQSILDHNLEVFMGLEEKSFEVFL